MDFGHEPLNWLKVFFSFFFELKFKLGQDQGGAENCFSKSDFSILSIFEKVSNKTFQKKVQKVNFCGFHF